MTLLEVARALGVETQHWLTFHTIDRKHERQRDRPDELIAHDVLAKLPPERFNVEWTGGTVFLGWDSRDPRKREAKYHHFNSFPECVRRLAERFLSERGADQGK